MSARDQYLTLYAEPECLQLGDFNERFQQGLVLPVYREAGDVLLRFTRFAEDNHGTLLILVINRPESDEDTAWSQPFFNHPLVLQWQSQNGQLSLLQLANNSSLLLIDRCEKHPAIADKQGVGLARKIGADVLCTLIERELVTTPWIFNTDADAHLPADYFAAVTATPNTTAAIIYPFEHSYPDQQLNPLPTLLYEFSLHYYVAGLQWAGSPYAFHTLGSTLAIPHTAYAAVRGFPKRAGAEDFYLLNKLAKTGVITSLDKPLIKLEARESTRVPFGTGPAVIALASLDDPLSMALYHPDSFLYLKALLGRLKHCAEGDASANPQEPGIDSALLDAVAAELGLAQALAHAANQGKTPTSRLRHLQQWFDGFKTLKFIHQLRDQKLASISFRELQEAISDTRYQEIISPRMRELISEIAQQA